jgi:Ca-activated chloride channel family protein
VFVLNAGTLIIHPRPSEGADVSAAAAVVVDFPDGEGVATYYGDTKTVLPAGEQKVTVKIGEGEISETIALAAGQTVEKDIIVGVGHVVLNAYYSAGGDKVEASGVTFNVVKAAKKIDGSRQNIGTTYGPDSKFDLPTGDYVVIASMEEASVEQAFNIRAGESKQVDAVLAAGVLAVSAPGFAEIAVFSAKKDIQGNRKGFGVGYSDTHQVTLPAGDYVVVAKKPDGSKEMPATVKAGERTEITVE